MDWANLISIVGGLVLGGGGILFYSQNKKAKQIDNDSRVAEEWRKLYVEEKERSDKVECKLDEINEKVSVLQIQISELKLYKCTDIKCENRRPPIEIK